MRELLIIFAVLLVVLVIISALGGSVRTSPTAPVAPSEAVRIPSLRQPFINDSMPAEVADLQTTMPDLAPPAASRVRAEEYPLVVGFDGSEALASF